ncbi:MAG: SRPBCC family protein [Bacteroidales bacterium]|jgi:uncharacterized protein YndB with AHSA1/START domain|nr:SRPBCC family protein [Bacteroidales bacterium]
MKLLKKIILVIVTIILIFLVIALFVDRNYSVERNVIINKPIAEVFDYVRYLKNQDNFSKWAMMDPEMQKWYRGTDGQPGFVSAWKSEKKNVGAGEQEILRIEEDKRIDYELRFLEPFESTQQAYITTTAIDSMQTRVAWGFNGHMAYPSNLMLLFMDFEEIVGDDFQTGLDKLKNELE